MECNVRRYDEGRVAAALPAFIRFVERDDRQGQGQGQGQNGIATGISRRRPVVTLLNQCILSIWKYAAGDPKFVDNIERYVDRDGPFVREYEADMKALATQVMNIYEANDHAESTECVVFQTNPTPRRFPTYSFLGEGGASQIRSTHDLKRESNTNETRMKHE